MKIIKKCLVTALAAALILTSVPQSGAVAAKKPKLSVKKVSINVGQTKKITVKNAKKNTSVKWSVTGKSKIAKITGKKTKGKKAFAKIKGVSAGTATLKAKVKTGKAKVNLKCTITVAGATAQTEAPVGNATAKPGDNGVTAAPTSDTGVKASEAPGKTEAPVVTAAATKAPTGSPKPTKTPTVAPTKMPPTSDFPKQDLDLSTFKAYNTDGTITVQSDGSLLCEDITGFLIHIPGEYYKDDVFKVTVQGTIEGPTSCRVWISDDGGNSRYSNQVNPMNFNETYELKLEDSSNDNSGAHTFERFEDNCSLQIKKQSYDSAAIQKMVITKITVEKVGSTPGSTAKPVATVSPEPVFEGYKWVTTWGTAEEKIDVNADRMPQTLNGTTVRQAVMATTSGNKVRLRLTNQYGGSAVTIQSLHLAKQVTPGQSTIDTSTDTVVTVGGSESFQIPAGKTIQTDAIDFNVTALDKICISAYFGNSPTRNISGHRGARANTYQVSGNNVSTATLSSPKITTAWYFLAEMSLLQPEDSNAGAVVCFGDSITDGYGTDTLGNPPDSYRRWGDYFAKRLQANEKTKYVSVINEGIGSNGMFGSYPTDAGRDRFKRDLLDHDGVKYCIILFGVNDLNKVSGTSTADRLITEYKKMVDLCHANGIKCYGAPITPFGTSSYYSTGSEQCRQKIRTWMISAESEMDGIIDFDTALADPNDPKNILEKYTHSDGLHPYDGYDVMANAIDLSLFE